MSHRTCLLLAAFCLLASSVALAQHWEFEQVDTAGGWTRLHLKQAPDGTLYLLYHEPDSGRTMLATYDTAWHYEPFGPYRWIPSLDVGSHGEVGMICDSGYVFRTDTGWVTSRPPFTGGLLAYDTSGMPGAVRDTGIGGFWRYIIFHELRDTTWTADTVGRFDTNRECVWLKELIYDADNTPYTFQRSWAGTDRNDGDFSTEFASLSARTPEGWRGRVLAGGEAYESIRVYDMARLPGGGVSCCWWTERFPPRRLVIDSLMVDTGGAPRAAGHLCESQSRRHLVYSDPQRNRTVYSEYAVDWQSETVMESAAIDVGGVVLDGERVTFAYLAPDSSVWLARRNPSGIHGQQRGAPQGNTAPTLVRGNLPLPPSLEPTSTWSLLSISGRKVLDLHPGENDIRCLSPGIYFIREESARATRKVIVAR